MEKQYNTTKYCKKICRLKYLMPFLNFLLLGFAFLSLPPNHFHTSQIQVTEK